MNQLLSNTLYIVCSDSLVFSQECFLFPIPILFLFNINVEDFLQEITHVELFIRGSLISYK